MGGGSFPGQKKSGKGITPEMYKEQHQCDHRIEMFSKYFMN